MASMKYEKGTFTITPNKEYRMGKPPELQTIFTWICEHADEDGICYPSRIKIAKYSGIKSVRTVDKYIAILVDDGVLAKTKRKKPASRENTSNLYQVQILPHVEQELLEGGANVDTTPGAPNIPITQPSDNSPQLTPIGALPEKYGKTPLIRLGYVYRKLWFRKYGTPCDLNFGRFGKAINTLLASNSEMMVAVLLFTFFNWFGGSGKDQRENDYLTNVGFPLEMLVKKKDITLAYLKNNIGLEIDSPEKIRMYAVRSLREFL